MRTALVPINQQLRGNAAVTLQQHRERGLLLFTVGRVLGENRKIISLFLHLSYMFVRVCMCTYMRVAADVRSRVKVLGGDGLNGSAAGKTCSGIQRGNWRPEGRKDGRGREEWTEPRSRTATWPGHSRPSPRVVIRVWSPRRTRNTSGAHDGPRGCWLSGRCNTKGERAS